MRTIGVVILVVVAFMFCGCLNQPEKRANITIHLSGEGNEIIIMDGGQLLYKGLPEEMSLELQETIRNFLGGGE